MVSINAQNLTFQFANGNTLFSDLNFSLNNTVTGLVGRNGVGKSILAALLTGDKAPYSGSVTRSCNLGCLRQIDADEKIFHYATISDFLNIKEKLCALARITAGGSDPRDFDLIGDQWLLREQIEQQLQLMGLPANPFLPCESLSGGQLTRLALHQLFQEEYDYLILDEPSNHLDGPGKAWLNAQIQQFTGGVLVISHDRSLLRSVDHILELTGLGLYHYGGGYGVYAEQKANILSRQQQRIDDAKADIKQIQRTAEKNRQKMQQRARQGKQLAGSGSQAKTLLDKQKNKAERSGGSRENTQNRQLGQMKDKLSGLLEQHERLKPQTFSLSQSEKRQSRILDVTDLRLPFIEQKTAITFSVAFGEKIQISGANGCGKSTLLKTIRGELSPIQGNIHLHIGLCYLDQHFTLLEHTKSAQENLAALCPHLSITDQRTLLAGVGLRREQADKRVANLSGGEKMKAAMLAVSHQLDNTLLLLDEPDNHLDLDSRQMLAQALRDFNGSLLVVSHDQDFIKELALDEEICLDA
ncbi:MAG: ATP-binding cassette domain-containing protein [Gammaproteobacteria bacterium]|nr:ATP-binding cassette domain-containing protein [Gammaproteobacteria bacterium]